MGASTNRTPRRRGQAGFSMVEMLLAAFIMAVGIMGLSLLQIMSLKTTRGGRSLATALTVANHVMDDIELEGRLSWLNISNTQVKAPTDLTTLQYVTKDKFDNPMLFNIYGRTPDANSADPAEKRPFFTVTMVRTERSAAATGKLSDFNVSVAFSDVVNPKTQAPIVRTVNLTRRIIHG